MEKMDFTDPFEGDTSFEEPKKKPPTPTPESPVISIVPIASKPFQPFTTFYISITKATNLHSCKLSSLYLCIRVKNTIRPILTTQAWCNDSDATFNCAYALDFSGVKDFALNSFSPVIELHERYSKKSVFVGFIICPLQITKVVTAMGKPLSFIYFDKQCDIHDVRTNSIVGNLNVTIALGEKEHAPILDPNSQTFLQIPPEEPVIMKKKVVAQKKTKAGKKKLTKNTKKGKGKASRKRRNYSDYSDYDYYSYSDENINWEEEALKAGWTRPGQKFDWKSKAKQAGWTPPSQVPMYSTETMCNFDESDRRNEEIQVLQGPYIDEISSINVHDSQLFDDNDIQGLVKALNVLPTNKSKIDIDEEEEIHEIPSRVDKSISPVASLHHMTIANNDIMDISQDHGKGSNLFSSHSMEEDESYEETKKEKKSSIILPATTKPLVLFEEEEEEEEEAPQKQNQPERQNEEQKKQPVTLPKTLNDSSVKKSTNSSVKEVLDSDEEESDNEELLKELAKQANSGLSGLRVKSFLEEEDEEEEVSIIPKKIVSPEISSAKNIHNSFDSESDTLIGIHKENEQSEEESLLLGDRKNIPKRIEKQNTDKKKDSDSDFDQELAFLLQQNAKQESFIDQIEEEEEEEEKKEHETKNLLTTGSKTSSKKFTSSLNMFSDDDDISDSFKMSGDSSSKQNVIKKVDNAPDFSVSVLSDDDEEEEDI